MAPKCRAFRRTPWYGPASATNDRNFRSREFMRTKTSTLGWLTCHSAASSTIDEFVCLGIAECSLHRICLHLICLVCFDNAPEHAFRRFGNNPEPGPSSELRRHSAVRNMIHSPPRFAEPCRTANRAGTPTALTDMKACRTLRTKISSIPKAKHRS